MGLPQGSMLSPLLFNIYLEEALRISPKLEQLRKRGDLLAFVDDMLLMSYNRKEVEEIDYTNNINDSPDLIADLMRESQRRISGAGSVEDDDEDDEEESNEEEVPDEPERAAQKAPPRKPNAPQGRPRGYDFSGCF